MKALLLITAILLPIQSQATSGCYAYGRSYAEGEQDCDGRVCGKDGVWTGVVKSGTCDVTDEEPSREPASKKKGKKGKKAKHHKAKKAQKKQNY